MTAKMGGREVIFIISLFSFHTRVTPLICHYCNIITDIYNPFDRVPCDTVRTALMRDSSQYTVACSDNEYCMHYKGQYRDYVGAGWREVEFAGCSGEDYIHIGDIIESEKATGAFVDWENSKRKGKICLSRQEKSCFDCDKALCDQMWPKPECSNGTLELVEESADQCCPEYKCNKLLVCHYCNIVTDVWNPMDRVSCDTVRRAIMRDASLYTMTCGDNEYCMRFKGQYRDHSRARWREVELGGCSGEDRIFVGDVNENEKATGAFVHWETYKRNGNICLSLQEKGCFDCDKALCDQMWPKPECSGGTLELVEESADQCCPEYKCNKPMICHYCNIVTDVWNPMDRVSCDTVRRAIMRDASLYTMTCGDNEYCMRFKGQYRDHSRARWREVEFGGCSGEDRIFTGDINEKEKATGAFVGWVNYKRNGNICLSLQEKGCFDCDKSKCDLMWPKPECSMGTLMLVDESSTQCCPEYKCVCDKVRCDQLWPKPDCPTGTLVPVDESADQCCAKYKCELPRTCYYCNLNKDDPNSFDTAPCEIVKSAVTKNESLYTTYCPYNEYCMYYKGLYKERDTGLVMSAEYAGCSGLERIYIGDKSTPEEANGTFIDWDTPTRKGRISLSKTRNNYFHEEDMKCDKTKCHQLGPSPECVIGTLRLIMESSNHCCPYYECVNTGKFQAVITMLVLTAVATIALVGCVWCRKKRGRRERRLRVPTDEPEYIQRQEITICSVVRTSSRNVEVQIEELSTDVALYDSIIKGDPVGDLRYKCRRDNLPPPIYKVQNPNHYNFVITCFLGIRQETGIRESETLAGRQAAHNMLQKIEDVSKKKIDIKQWLGDEDQGYTYFMPLYEGTRGRPEWCLQRLCMLCNSPPPSYKMKMSRRRDEPHCLVICISGKHWETSDADSLESATQEAARKMLPKVQTELVQQRNSEGRLQHKYQSYTNITLDDYNVSGDPVGDLQKLCELCGLPPPRYRMSSTTPPHAHHVSITCNTGHHQDTGDGESETLAGRQVADNMLHIIWTGLLCQMNIKHWQPDKHEFSIGSAVLDNDPSYPVGNEFYDDVRSALVVSEDYDDIPGNPTETLLNLCLDRAWTLPWYRVDIGQQQDRWIFRITCHIGNHETSGDDKSLSLSRRKAAHEMLQKIDNLSAWDDIGGIISCGL